MLYFWGLRLLTPLAKLFFPFRVKGSENIPADGKLIVCCNHKSLVDPFLLAVPFRRQVRYMAKSELFEDHGELARRLLYRLGAFPVKRDRGDMESVRTALKILGQGGILGIFPQGKCVFDNAPFQPKAGAAMIAIKAHAPILPACIYCDGIVRPFRRITLRFGQIIPYEMLIRGGDLRENIRSASALLSEKINGLLEEKY
jgi:1-acyl-sn-glycerol-3-phosphate acyltransferase